MRCADLVKQLLVMIKNERNLAMKEILDELKQYVPNARVTAKMQKLYDRLGAVAAHYDNEVKIMTADDAIMANNTLEGLVKLANRLDDMGHYALADKVTEIAQMVKIANEVQPPHEGTLSTRYCPDHRGVQAARIGQHTYQCPLDGKIYNYEEGYTNYEGQIVPGGSVAEQTPRSFNHGGVPMRFFDPKYNAINYGN